MPTKSMVHPAVRALVAIAVAVSLSSCALARADRDTTSKPDDRPGVRSTGRISVDGRIRTYRLYQPARASSDNPLPLVVMLHGGFGTGEQAEAAYGWDELADREGVLVAYPDGVGRAWNVGGGCCGEPGRSGVDDVAFIEELVRTVSADHPVDPARVFATGISNGGMMAYRLACDSDMFAAIGVDAATLLGSCDGARPVSVMHIHGLADTSVRFDGAKGTGVARIDGPPVPEVIAQWRAVGDCDQPRETSLGPVHTSSATCAEGREVTLITIDGAGHQWPVGPGDPEAAKPRRLADPPSTALDATSTFWAFFEGHPRNA